jgi:uncharacterized protein DUF5666
MKEEIMKTLSVLMLSLLLATSALAHGGMEHVMGTVSAVSDHSITVKTTAGDSKEVGVNESTKFMRGQAAAGLSDVHVGDRVVIHATEHEDKLEAAEVQLGAAKGKQR